MNAKSKIPEQNENIVWNSNGHKPKIFKGLFENPYYSNIDQFLQQEALTKQTKQVRKVASIINNKKDISTLKEILNLLRSIKKDKRPKATFEVTASKILSYPILGGCTTFATAFSTLCRTKGIPAVVVDSAYLDWILGGCSLNYVRGHFFVEVYINNKWYLVDSTAGKLYKQYDRSNWFLPNKYIAFTKSLSFIDPGTTERNHNLLQRVAFVNKNINYKNPDYPVLDLNSYQIENDIKKEYSKLNIKKDDNELKIKRSIKKVEIKADSSSIDFGYIPIK
jgi:hypothetical protein